MNLLERVYIKFRQWTFPSEFRIEIQEGDDRLSWLIQVLTEASTTYGKQENENIPLTPEFVVSLCNNYFRTVHDKSVLTY